MRISSLTTSAFFALAALIALATAPANAEPVSPSLAPTITQAEAGSASAYAWVGTWFSNSYAGGYGGFLKSLNETDDLWSDGFVLRGDVSGGNYTFDSFVFPPHVNVDTIDADAMIGYRTKIDKGNFSAYVGPSYVLHDNPDPTAHLRGSEWGAKFLAEYSGPVSDNLDGYVQGSYTTAFDTYNVTGRLLWRVADDVSVGPQVTLYGNRDPYQESTFGPVVKFNTDFGEIGVSGGYRHPWTGHDPDGYFASLYLGIPIE